jgi:hypothetical protein
LFVTIVVIKNTFGIFNRTRRRIRALREMVAKLADEEGEKEEERKEK